MARVLIVEDESGLTELMTMLLNGEGHEVLACDSATECLRLVSEEKPDLIILDLWLETEWAGLDALAQIKADAETRDIPVLVCTAKSERLLQQLGDQYRDMVEGVVAKPFNIADLIKAVGDALKRSSVLSLRVLLYPYTADRPPSQPSQRSTIAA